MSDPNFGSIDLARQYETASEPQFTHGRDLIELLAPRRRERVLDVGCGTGRLASMACGRVGGEGRVVGIDPAAPRIELARQLGDGSVQFHVGQAEDLSAFAAASFDVAYANSVLGWIRDKPRALAEAHRVLVPGGRMGIATTVRERPNELRSLIRAAQSGATEKKGAAGSGAATETAAGRAAYRGPERRVTFDSVRDLLHAAAFAIRVFELRTYLSRFDDVAHIIEFLRATTYDDFLPEMTPSSLARFAAALERAVAEHIPPSRRTNGIRLERHVLLVVADKPVRPAPPARG